MALLGIGLAVLTLFSLTEVFCAGGWGSAPTPLGELTTLPQTL